MKKDRTRLIIGILLSLVLFSSSIGLWLYTKEKNLSKEMQQMRYVYVMAKDVKKGTRISDADIRLERYPKEVISWKTPKKGEILHRYAKTDLYKGEPLMASKLSTQPIVEKKEITKQKAKVEKPKIQKKNPFAKFKGDTITLSLASFHNIDPTLKSGDKVDIASIDASVNELKNDNKLKIRYAAIGVSIISFGYGTSQHKSATRKINTKNGIKTLTADNVTLAVTPKNVQNLLALYYKTKSFNSQRAYNENNKGHLWLIKSKVEDKKLLQEKKKLLLDYKAPAKQRAYRKKRDSIRIEYEK